MRLRVRHPSGASILDSLAPEHTITDLKETIAKEIGGLSWQQVEVSGGYPFRKYTNDSDTLETAGIRNGDALNVRILDTPAFAQQQPKPQQRSQATKVVETSGGYLSLRTVPDDNSCLFRSLGKLKYNCFYIYVLSRDTSMSDELRSVIAATIKEDPIEYSEATLGQNREKYIDWIQKETSWGGAIEIASIDVQTGRIDRFDYDALALAPMKDAPPDFDQTRFPVEDDSILEAAKKLAEILRQKRKFTDVANFTLKCNQCQTGLVGEKGNHTGILHLVTSKERFLF
ncbi:hypothetical protein BDA99DRAFT_433536 [Phascolomyces articulosus]|uniref:Ubiquitin thioesterase OTU n=1 Tax=Phascolomyces articulosus TaxID=60185 RepID=A0AAD5K6X3_9FUNG|nr:hypothetical protein BDA99DRAFT_433536 [Phascolomyces articulosus]